jgi:hypothetical protein
VGAGGADRTGDMSGMPWIKLNPKIIDSVRLYDLTDQQLCRFIQLILLAGECNREGKLIDQEKDYVLTEEYIAWRLKVPIGSLKKDMQVLREHGLLSHNLNLWVVEEYLTMWKSGIDYDLYPDDWPGIRATIMTRDEYTCQLCGKKGELFVHHVLPLTLGGGNEDLNLITVCRQCHKQLHAEIRVCKGVPADHIRLVRVLHGEA